MYGHMIVGVDGRQGGRDAAALGAALTGPDGVRAIVFVGGTLSGAGAPSTLELELAADAAVPGLLAAELRLAGAGTQVVRVVDVAVGGGLEAAAEQHGAELIVVGRSARRGLSRLRRGDDVVSTLHHSARAVAVAPPGFARDPRPLRRIGVACDRSPEGTVALAHAGLLAEARQAQLSVFRIGDADHGSLAALGREVDLLVCGFARGRSLHRWLLGTAAASLARDAEVPLLIAPPVDTASLARWRTRQPDREVEVS